MANDIAENVLFSSEVDNSAFIQGMRELINSLKEGSEAQKKLQTEFKNTTQQVEKVQVELKGATTEFDKTNKGTKASSESAEALTKKIQALSAANKALIETQKAQEAELNNLKAKNETLNTTLKNVESTQKQVQATFGKKIVTAIDTGTLNQANTKLEQLKANFNSIVAPKISGLFDTKQLDLLLQHVKEGKGEFEQMSRYVQALSAALVTVEPGTEEFEDLSAAIKAGNQVIKEYTTLYKEATEAVEDSEPAYKTIRSRLADYRKELDLLEKEGKEETEQFKQVQIAAAQLTDQYGDMQAQIQILASDTKNLDFGVDLINAGAAGLQVYSGALALVGASAEDAEQIQTRLLAIMSLVQGVQQLQNLLLKESVIRTVGANLATNIYAGSQRLLAVTLGATAAASKAANAALITTGVGALVIALGFLISKIMEWNDANEEAVKSSERLNESIKRQAEFMKEDLAMIDQNTKFREERIKARGNNEALLYEAGQQGYQEKVIQYNERLRSLQKTFDDLDLQALNARNKEELKLIQGNKKTVVDEQLKLIAEIQQIKQANNFVQAQEDTRIANEEEKRLKRIRDIRRENLLRANADFDERKDLINLKAENDEKIRELNRAGIETATTEEMYQIKRGEIIDRYNKLRAEKERQLRKEISLIGKTEEEQELINLKAERDNQAKELRRIDASTASLDELTQKRRLEIIRKYQALRAAAEKENLDEEEKLSIQAAEARVANVQNEFQRESEAIRVEGIKQRDELQAQKQESIDRLVQQRSEGLINRDEYEATVNSINDIFNDLFNELEVSISNRSIELGSKILQGAIQGMNDTLAIANNGISEAGKNAVTEASNNFSNGKISYERYQKELTRITREENEARFQNNIEAFEKELALVDQRLRSNKISEAERKNLEKQQSELKLAIAENQAGLASQDAEDLQAEKNRKAEHLQKIIALYSAAFDVITGFLSELNRQEQARLDRSIALQQKRVDSAKEIAERGNAEFLELEQKRLDELEQKREANARRQMVIDNAVRVSQAGVAAVSAIAQASASGGVIAAIGAGVAVLALLASIYSAVSSMQQPSAEFAEGTTFVEGKPGRDQIPAKVTRGEAIIPAERNAKYSESVKAIYYEKVPAHILNQFVANYPAVNIPSVDYSRLGNATDKHILKGSDAEVTKRLDQVNQGLQLVAEKLDKLDNVSVSIDQDGFALSILRQMQHEKMKWLN